MFEPGSDVGHAWSKSIFARLPDRAARLLVDSAVERELAPGTIAYWEPRPKESRTILALVISGLLRLYVASDEGRQLTLRYDREGAVFGLSSVVAGGAPARLEAVTTSRILSFQVDVMRHLVKTDAAVASLVAESLTNSLFMIQEMLVNNVFGTVRARVASHLMDLAVPDANGVLSVHVGQQDIADAIGSVREVVSRVLGALRRDGIIAGDRHGIVLVDLERLNQIASRTTTGSTLGV